MRHGGGQGMEGKGAARLSYNLNFFSQLPYSIMLKFNLY
jgi:hypothetical protein